MDRVVIAFIENHLGPVRLKKPYFVAEDRILAAGRRGTVVAVCNKDAH
jgi:hypothetical protein